METVVKVNPIQSGPFDANNNLIDFILPNAQYNLSKSYFNIELDVPYTTTSGGLVNYEFGNGEGVALQNIVLVKNARMTSDRGVIEDLRRCDVLNQQIASYAMSFEDMEAKQMGDLVMPRGEGNNKPAPAQEIYKLGNKESLKKTINLEIPVKDIYHSGRLKQFPADQLGDVRLHLETQLGIVTAGLRSATPADPTAPTAGERADADVDFGKAEFRDFKNVTNAGDVTQLTTESFFPDMTNSPFFVGQSLIIHATNDTTAIGVERKITEISQNADQELVLTFNSSIATVAATKSMTGIECFNPPVTFGDKSFSKVELTLVKIPAERVETLEYMTFEHEADNGNALQSFERQYLLPAECMNVIVCPTNASDRLCEQGSTANSYQLDKYRLRLEGHGDLTDRDVQYKTPLYYNQIGNTMTRLIKKFKNSTEKLLSLTHSHDAKFGNGKDISFIGSSLPMTETSKKLQVNIECPASRGVNNLHIYKQVAKVIKF